MERERRQPPVQRTGRSELPTELEPEVDPALVRARVARHTQQLERLSTTVDGLIERAARDGQHYASRDAVWALRQRLEQIEEAERKRGLAALAVLAAAVAWTGMLTLVVVLLMVAGL